MRRPRIQDLSLLELARENHRLNRLIWLCVRVNLALLIVILAIQLFLLHRAVTS